MAEEEKLESDFQFSNCAGCNGVAPLDTKETFPLCSACKARLKERITGDLVVAITEPDDDDEHSPFDEDSDHEEIIRLNTADITDELLSEVNKLSMFFEEEE